MNRALSIYLIFLAALFASVLYAGPVDQTVGTHDIFGLIEGGWKIFNGNRPYIDFYTILGPIPHLIMAMGFVLAGPTTQAFPAIILFSLIPVAALAWYVISRRLRRFPCFLATSYLALVWVAPFPLHYDCIATSYAMLYNRQAYVLLSILFIAFIPGPARNPFCIGILLGLLFFFKVPYALAALILTVFYAAWSPPSRKESFWACLGFSLVAIPVTVYLGGISGLLCMASSFYHSGQARSPDIYWASLQLFLKEMPLPAVLTAVALFCLIRRCAGRPPSGEFRTLFKSFGWLSEGAMIGSIVFITEMGGSWLGYLYDVPLLCIYNIVLIDRFLAQPPADRLRRDTLTMAAGLACCLVLVLPLWTRCLLGTLLTVKERLHPPRYLGEVKINARGFEDIRLCYTCGQYPRGVSYAAKVNDGLDLIRRHHELDDVFIGTLEFTDSFSFPLGRKSPPHMPIWIQYGANVRENICPDPDVIFSGCQALMVPKYPDSDERTLQILTIKYRQFIQSNFSLRDESPEWMLYIKKSG